MGITKAECKRVALETLIRVAGEHSLDGQANALSAAQSLLYYAVPPQYGYGVPGAPPPSAPDAPVDEED
jgi:hypothetical protein